MTSEGLLLRQEVASFIIHSKTEVCGLRRRPTHFIGRLKMVSGLSIKITSLCTHCSCPAVSPPPDRVSTGGRVNTASLNLNLCTRRGESVYLLQSSCQNYEAKPNFTLFFFVFNMQDLRSTSSGRSPEEESTTSLVADATAAPATTSYNFTVGGVYCWLSLILGVFMTVLQYFTSASPWASRCHLSISSHLCARKRQLVRLPSD